MAAAKLAVADAGEASAVDAAEGDAEVEAEQAPAGYGKGQQVGGAGWAGREVSAAAAVAAAA